MTTAGLIPRPGVVVRQFAADAPPSDPTDPSRGFLVGITGSGPTVPTVVASPRHYDQLFGVRDDGPTMWDATDRFFALAGRAPLVIRRRVGAAAVKATVMAPDTAGIPVDAIRFDALWVGEYANGATGGFDVLIANGTTSGKKVTVTEDDQPVEIYDNLATNAAIVDALATSQYLRGTALAGGLVANGTYVLAGGTDDRAGVTDATLPTDLASIGKEIGIGQLAVPLVATVDAYKAIIDHVNATNRVAYLDPPAAATKATVSALFNQIRSYPGSHRAAPFTSLTRFTGPLPGTTRWVSTAAAAAGRTAQSDRRNHPIWAVAGSNGLLADDRGRSVGAVDVELPLSEADWSDLYEDGVNPVIVDRFGVRIYGARSLTDDPRWRWMPDARVAMYLTARVREGGEAFLGGEPTTPAKIRRFHNYCLAEMQADAAVGAFHTPPGEDTPIFDVDTSVNVGVTIADGQLLAELSYTPSATTEQVVVGVTHQPIAA